MNGPFPSRLTLAAALAATLLGGGCHRDDGDALTVVVTLPEQRLAGVAKATIEVDYSGAGASILSEDGGPACAFILPGVEGDFADDRKGKLLIHAQGPRAAHGPADLAACRMKAGDHDATPEDLKKKLTVKLTSAEDAAGKPVDLSAKAAAKGGGASARNDAEIEAAQAEAAKAAVAAAPAPAPGATTTAPGGVPGQAGAGGAAAGAPASAAPIVMPAPAGVIPKPAAPSRSVASGSSAAARAGGSAVPSGQPYGGGGEGSPNPPGNQDRDPGYDDSDGDNPNLPAYDVEVGVTTPGRLGALQLKITHLGSSGGFIGRGDQLDCTPTVDAMMAQNWPGERTAQIGLINIQGFRTPASVLRCGFRSRESLSAASFLVEVVDASDAGTTGANGDPKPLDPEPTAVILSINRR